MRTGFGLEAAAFVLIATGAFAGALPDRGIPMAPGASRALQETISLNYASECPWQTRPENAQEWKQIVDTVAAAREPLINDLIRTLQIRCEKIRIGDVKAFMLEPADIPEQNCDKILLFFHGGGYVFNPGESGLDEGLYMAAIAKYKILAVDYRLAPEFPFPAALEDALAAYRHLLKTYPAKDIGVFGSSTGGALTLALCLLLREENLPMPGAIAPGTPWSDLSKTGDSYFLNDGADNVLVSYDGLLEAMAKAYANGHDLKDPLLSPVYGELRGFPPALLVTGSRDLFLSNTARVHRKLREAGVPADLLVIEGLSHWQYVELPPDAPESQYYFREAAAFFRKYLGK